ncbi:hypothetical protein MNBD_GAMMA23-1361 [hydrothermal vent metagenome]|uniref:PTS EIIA type-4 domain-containing protein n=1 Tax=hydrothermal vent metagenome TaxID=652676 RepID=A0A3B1AB98_9ZZZZ
MSVSVLIITHDKIGQVILDAAVKIIGSCPMPIRAISIDMDCDYKKKLTKITAIISELDSHTGLLILTDLYGATPSNIATSIDIENSIVVAGLNLPMLIRVMNYHTLPLYELGDKAIGGGKDGVLTYYTDKYNKNATLKN